MQLKRKKTQFLPWSFQNIDKSIAYFFSTVGEPVHNRCRNSTAVAAAAVVEDDHCDDKESHVLPVLDRDLFRRKKSPDVNVSFLFFSRSYLVCAIAVDPLL